MPIRRIRILILFRLLIFLTIRRRIIARKGAHHAALLIILTRLITGQADIRILFRTIFFIQFLQFRIFLIMLCRGAHSGSITCRHLCAFIQSTTGFTTSAIGCAARCAIYNPLRNIFSGLSRRFTHILLMVFSGFILVIRGFLIILDVTGGHLYIRMLFCGLILRILLHGLTGLFCRRTYASSNCSSLAANFLTGLFRDCTG